MYKGDSLFHPISPNTSSTTLKQENLNLTQTSSKWNIVLRRLEHNRKPDALLL